MQGRGSRRNAVVVAVRALLDNKTATPLWWVDDAHATYHNTHIAHIKSNLQYIRTAEHTANAQHARD